MPDDPLPDHCHETWVSNGTRVTMDKDCNCAGNTACLRTCHEGFDADVAGVKGVLPKTGD